VTGWRDSPAGHSAIPRMLLMIPILAVFWLALSGHYEPLMLALGLVSVAVVFGMAWRGDFHLHRDVTVRFALRLPLFLAWVAWQVFVSAIGVVRKVWSPRLELRPVVAPTPADALPELAKVVYANSITLTPGTLALDVDEEQILVHGIDQSDVDDLDEGAMLRQVRRLGERR
jgi:multicomponent Na+:H+ antiporter subunit E